MCTGVLSRTGGYLEALGREPGVGQGPGERAAGRGAGWCDTALQGGGAGATAFTLAFYVKVLCWMAYLYFK